MDKSKLIRSKQASLLDHFVGGATVRFSGQLSRCKQRQQSIILSDYARS